MNVIYVNRDAWVISFMDTFTSLLASCTIFAVLGYLSHESGLPIKDVAKGGPGLAFVSYPEAIAKFDWVPQVGFVFNLTNILYSTNLSLITLLFIDVSLVVLSSVLLDVVHTWNWQCHFSCWRYH